MQDSLQRLSQSSHDSVSSLPVISSLPKTVKRKLLEIKGASPGSNKSTEATTTQSVLTIQPDTPSVTSAVENAKQINFFSGHELKVIHDGPQSLNRVSPDWVFPILLLVLAAFAWLRTYYNKYFVQIMAAFWNNNLTNQIVRDESILVQRASVILNILFNLVAALFLYFVSIYYLWPLGGIGTGINRYLFFALIVTAAYAVKFLVLKICGYLFHITREMSTYLFNVFLINNILCLMLIPLVALFAFSNFINAGWLMVVSITLVMIAYLYRIVRGLAIGWTSAVFSPYYLFLYLCTLEFAPLLLLIKILSQK